MDIDYHKLFKEEGIESCLDLYQPCVIHYSGGGGFGCYLTSLGVQNLESDYAHRIKTGTIVDRGRVHTEVDFRVPDGKGGWRPETSRELADAIQNEPSLHWLSKVNLLHNLQNLHGIDAFNGWCTDIADEVIREMEYEWYVFIQNTIEV